MNVLEIAARTVGSFIVLLLLTRLMGRKQISQLTFFNYITGISIGTLAATISIDRTINLSESATALIVWTVLTLLVGYISIKSKKARKIINGQPEIVIKDGKVMEETLKRVRMNTEELSLLLRNQSVFSMKDVDCAILETNGEISVLKKQDYQTLTKKDMKIPNKNKIKMATIPTEIIVDGKIISESLQKLNLNQNWLDQQLQQAGIQSIKDVFYAEIQEDGSLYIDQKNDNILH